jgi:hypothetical protein
LKKLFEIYCNYCIEIKNTERTLQNLKIRRPVFPEIISEYIVLKFLQKYNTSQEQHCKNILYIKDPSGDLLKIDNTLKIKIEIKCSSSKGPLSFGPTQKFDELYCVDASDFLNDKIIIYKINEPHKIKELYVNKFETFQQQCEQKRRPRISLQNILSNRKNKKKK